MQFHDTTTNFMNFLQLHSNWGSNKYYRKRHGDFMENTLIYQTQSHLFFGVKKLNKGGGEKPKSLANAQFLFIVG